MVLSDGSLQVYAIDLYNMHRPPAIGSCTCIDHHVIQSSLLVSLAAAQHKSFSLHMCKHLCQIYPCKHCCVNLQQAWSCSLHPICTEWWGLHICEVCKPGCKLGVYISSVDLLACSGKYVLCCWHACAVVYHSADAL